MMGSTNNKNVVVNALDMSVFGIENLKVYKFFFSHLSLIYGAL